MKRTLTLKWLSVLLIGLITAPLLLSVHDEQSYKISPRLKAVLADSEPETNVHVWIYFTDKGQTALPKFNSESLGISPEAVMRRQKKGTRHATDEADWPVETSYIELLRQAGVQIRHTSRWLNAVSAEVPARRILEITEWSFIQRIDRIQRMKRTKRIAETETKPMPLPLSKKSTLDYGASLAQLSLLKVPEVHQYGFAGQGVTIAVFDAGFDNLSHEVFSKMISEGRLLADSDFVNGDDDVSDEGDLGEGSHGTQTLSTMGGYKPGQLIGPAYKASFLLAKTENTESETPAEEDNWIAAIEWAERRGADIISSSLGYIQFDATCCNHYDSTDYNWQWMTGDSTRITQAANMAVARGVIVVNSAGNEGDATVVIKNTLGAPSDGDSVIAVGAVNTSGIRTSFSSVGPTTHGAIKPNVMATGSNVRAAGSTTNTSYVGVSGTSFACPLTAGICAMLLSAHPDLTPAQVRYALQATADRADNPDNHYGYGVVNAWDAINYFGQIDSGGILPDKFKLHQNSPNPFNPQTTIRYDVLRDGYVAIIVYNMLGQRVRTLYDGFRSQRRNYEVQWDGRDESGHRVASGVYLYRLTADGFSQTKRMLLVK
ncbi:S8 family serine peptidase [bacterium]|nr:S8 family serine peptidase [bacterium]NUN45641.1 S8 family serine peptidase [bacterium]